MAEPYRIIVEIHTAGRAADPLDKAFDLPHHRITVLPDCTLFEYDAGLKRNIKLAHEERIGVGRSKSQCRILFPNDIPLLRKISNVHGELYRVAEEGTHVWKYKGSGSNLQYINGTPLPNGVEALIKGPTTVLDIPHKDIAQLVIRLYQPQPSA